MPIILSNPGASNTTTATIPAGGTRSVVAAYSVGSDHAVTFVLTNTGTNTVTGLQLTAANLPAMQGGTHVPLLTDADFTAATDTLLRGLFGANSSTSLPAGASCEFTVDYLGAVVESNLLVSSTGGTTVQVQAYRA